MDDANFNPGRRSASAHRWPMSRSRFDGPIDLQSLRLYGLPEAAPAVLNGIPLLDGCAVRLRAVRGRGEGVPGPAKPGAGGDGADRCDGERGVGWRPGNVITGVVDSVHRARCGRVVEQHGAGDGAEHLGRDLRSGGGYAFGGGDETAGALSVLGGITWRLGKCDQTKSRGAPVTAPPPCFRLEGRPYGRGQRAFPRASRPAGCVIGPRRFPGSAVRARVGQIAFPTRTVPIPRGFLPQAALGPEGCARLI